MTEQAGIVGVVSECVGTARSKGVSLANVVETRRYPARRRSRHSRIRCVVGRTQCCSGRAVAPAGFETHDHTARRQVTRGAKAVVDEAQSSVHGARASRGGHTGRAIVFLMAYAGTASLPSHGEVSPRACLTRRGSRGSSRAADGRESARLAQGDWSRWRDLHADGTSLTGRSPVTTSECVGVPRVPRLRYIVHDQERRCTDDWWLPGVDQLILQLRIANEECLSTVAPTD